LKNKIRLDFLFELTRRNIIERYIGSAFILLWVLMVPIIPLLTNLLIFYFIANIPQIQGMGIINYSVFIFSGLLPYRIFQKAAAESGEQLISKMPILKNVFFPLPYIGLSFLGTLLFEFILQFSIMLILLFISDHAFTLRLLLLPIILTIFSLLLIGSIWLISVVGYLFKDIKEVINVSFLALVYITPTMYPIEAAPKFLQPLFHYNPLTHMTLVFRDVLIPSDGSYQFSSWIYFTLFSLFIFVLGYACINKIKRYVGDMV